MRLKIILICLILLSFTAQTARAAGRVAFDCPDLHNEKKRSIEPLFQGYDGWFFRENDLKMDFSISPETAQYFRRLNEALAAKGIKLIVLPLLSRALMAPAMVDHDDPWQENYDPDLAKTSYQDFVKSLKAEGLDALDVSSLIDEYGADPYAYNFKRDIHWKPESARLVAQLIAKELKALSNYPSFAKTKTVSKKRDEVGRTGTIMEELQKLCKGDIKAEPFYPYEAERVLDQNADALFGSGAAATPVALVGTSFSAVDEFNFLPFIEEASGAETANFSIAGGGMFTSLLSYLTSPFFQENAPPVLIWETQAVYDFNKGTEYGFRQAIPAVNGPCSGANILASSTVSLNGEDKPYVLLDNLKDKKAGGDSYYLHIASDNLGFKRFALEMDYDDQDGEWFPIDRSDRYNNRGHYYVELSDKIASDLVRVTMKDAGGSITKLDVQLCRKPAQNSAQPQKENSP